MDSDGDGVPDVEDSCPNSAGSASANGCPDADGDGIADHEDKCVNAAGLKVMNGCPDSDGDGLADAEDSCPFESGNKENGGCPLPEEVITKTTTPVEEETIKTEANPSRPAFTISSSGSPRPSLIEPRIVSGPIQKT